MSCAHRQKDSRGHTSRRGTSEWLFTALLRYKIRTQPQIVEHAGGNRDSGVQRQSIQIDVNAGATMGSVGRTAWCANWLAPGRSAAPRTPAVLQRGRAQAALVCGAFEPLRVGCRGRAARELAGVTDTAQVREYARISPHAEATIGSPAAKPNQSLSNSVSYWRI